MHLSSVPAYAFYIIIVTLSLTPMVTLGVGFQKRDDHQGIRQSVSVLHSSSALFAGGDWATSVHV